MKKISNRKRSRSAESIARQADKGGDISSYFTNKGKMMPPLPSVDAGTDYRLVAETLKTYQEHTRDLMDSLQRRDLVYEFFFVFSRFEHALSVTNYLTEARGGVSADWDKFARDINEVFLAALSPEVRKAVTYYEESPPLKQVVDFDSLTWKNVVPKTDYQLERLLLLVRRVRNNLFHGEKIGVLLEGNSQRDEDLLRYGLTILYACLQTSKDIRKKFFNEIEWELEEDEEKIAV